MHTLGIPARRGRGTSAPGAAALVLLLGLAAPLRAAELKLASVFGDHMVLQRDRKACVWGTGRAGAGVEVGVAGQRVTATADAEGRWRAYLAPVAAGGPYRLEVSSGGATAVVEDVLFGDVWLCSGQSNMQMPVKECEHGAERAAVAGRYRGLRLCTVGKGWNARPQASAEIKWRASTPEAASSFSAVGYFFATELLGDPALADVPVGVIDSSFGGTVCEGWIPGPALAGFDAKDLHDSMFGIKPAMLYNAMIAPLGPSAIKGVVWYQGESNAGRPDAYPRLLKTMVDAWRGQFGAPELPFVVVELPDFAQRADGLYWSWFREAQAKAVRAIPHAVMAAGINTTDGFNLHPKQKLEIGRRVALLARREVYGRPVVARGPVFKGAAVEGAAIRVTFDTRGDGLAGGGGGPILGFAVAGEDGAYRFAEATMDGESVVVRSDRVPAPRTVRYAWAGVPNSTLTNQSGLPAEPFRTDDFAPSNVEVQRRPVARTVTTSAYEITVDGEGKVTSLGVRGRQFLSNALGAAGGTSIPVLFGSRSLDDIREIGPDLLACGDGQVTLLLAFRADGMDWTLTNRGNDELKFRVALAPQVKVSGQPGPGPLTLVRGKSSLTVTGVDSVSPSDEGTVLQAAVKGGGTTRLGFVVGGR